MGILGDRLKWLREEKRLGQKELAGHIGISLSGLQKMEYGESNPKVDTLKKIAEYLTISSDFLLGLSDLTDQLRKDYIQLFELRKEVKSEWVNSLKLYLIEMQILI